MSEFDKDCEGVVEAVEAVGGGGGEGDEVEDKYVLFKMVLNSKSSEEEKIKNDFFVKQFTTLEAVIFFMKEIFKQEILNPVEELKKIPKNDLSIAEKQQMAILARNAFKYLRNPFMNDFFNVVIDILKKIIDMNNYFYDKKIETFLAENDLTNVIPKKYIYSQKTHILQHMSENTYALPTTESDIEFHRILNIMIDEISTIYTNMYVDSFGNDKKLYLEIKQIKMSFLEKYNVLNKNRSLLQDQIDTTEIIVENISLLMSLESKINEINKSITSLIKEHDDSINIIYQKFKDIANQMILLICEKYRSFGINANIKFDTFKNDFSTTINECNNEKLSTKTYWALATTPEEIKNELLSMFQFALEIELNRPREITDTFADEKNNSEPVLSLRFGNIAVGKIEQEETKIQTKYIESNFYILILKDGTFKIQCGTGFNFNKIKVEERKTQICVTPGPRSNPSDKLFKSLINALNYPDDTTPNANMSYFRSIF